MLGNSGVATAAFDLRNSGMNLISHWVDLETPLHLFQLVMAADQVQGLLFCFLAS